MRALGVTLADAARACALLTPVPGRMDRVPSGTDAPEIVEHILLALPADAKGSWVYDPATTSWELRAAIWTPTPAAEHAGGDVVEGLPALHDVQVVVHRQVEEIDHLEKLEKRQTREARVAAELVEAEDERRVGVDAQHLAVVQLDVSDLVPVLLDVLLLGDDGRRLDVDAPVLRRA